MVQLLPQCNVICLVTRVNPVFWKPEWGISVWEVPSGVTNHRSSTTTTSVWGHTNQLSPSDLTVPLYSQAINSVRRKRALNETVVPWWNRARRWQNCSTRQIQPKLNRIYFKAQVMYILCGNQNTLGAINTKTLLASHKARTWSPYRCCWCAPSLQFPQIPAWMVERGLLLLCRGGRDQTPHPAFS